MKFLFVMTTVFLSSAAAIACSVAPGFKIPYKNQALTNVANELGADLSSAEISVEDYKHKIAWKFTDAGFQCHDSNTVSMKVTLKFGNPWNSKQICVAQVNVTEISEPEVNEGPIVVKSDIKELHNSCK